MFIIIFFCAFNMKTSEPYGHLVLFVKVASVFALLKPHSHCAGVATVHPDAGQPVYRDAPGHIS